MASPIRLGDEVVLNIDGKILPTEISKTFKGLAVKYAPADSSECWYYKLTNVTTTSGNLISEESFVSKGGLTRGIDVGTSSSKVSPVDKVKFLFIVHSGLRDAASTDSSESIYLSLSGSTAAHNGTDCIEVGPKECWFGRMNNTTVSDINVISGTKNGSGAGSNKISCFVAAIIEDV
tara:strand:+ start:2871 stop:3401 length:531 start_codon:yes stop_codon:yes gene_type:complete